MGSPVTAGPLESEEGFDAAGFARHVYSDLHHIAELLDRIDRRTARLDKLIDDYEQPARTWLSMARMRRAGRGGG